MNKLHHRIWFGSSLPRTYRLNLLRFKFHNPRYEIHLWTDDSTLTPEEKQHFEDFCEKHNFKLHFIHAHHELLNFDLITEELDKARTNVEKRRVHFVRASDLARISIEYEMGGLYLDTDTNSLTPLPEFSSRYGFLLKRLHLFERIEQGLNYDRPTEFGMVFNDFLAAEAKNPFVKFVTEIARLDYRTYHNSQHRLWESSIFAEIHLYATVRLTGSSIRFALNYQVAHGEIVATLANESDLFFEDEMYLDSTYDKSWLIDLSSAQDKNIPREEKASMEAFRDEIDEKRTKSYPYHLPSIPMQEQFELPQFFKDFRPDPEPLPFDVNAFKTNFDLGSFMMERPANDVLTNRELAIKVLDRKPSIFFKNSNFILPEIKPVDLNLTVIGFPLFSQTVELLTGYLGTIPRQGFTKFFAKPPVFYAVSTLVGQLNANQLMFEHQLFGRLHQILESLPEGQKASLREIITTLKHAAKPSESIQPQSPL